MRIGLVPGSFKPYHAGHDGLVAIASRENDTVKLFVSLGDRIKPGEFPLYGKNMREIWEKYLEKAVESAYPNVEVVYAVKAPVSHVYDELKAGDFSEDEYTIYSDEEDILKYTDASLERTAPNLFMKDLIALRGVKRAETVDISGTYMRELLAAKKVKEFSRLLPTHSRKYAQEILDILNRQMDPTVAAGRSKRQKRPIGESLLRSYVREILR